MTLKVAAAFSLSAGEVVTIQQNDSRWNEFDTARAEGFLREVEAHGSNSSEFSLTAKGRRALDTSGIGGFVPFPSGEMTLTASGRKRIAEATGEEDGA